MSLEIFENKAKELQNIGFGKEVCFRAESFPIISEVSTIENIYLELRQRFIQPGLVDNLILHVNKKDSIILGLWILASAFQQNYKRYILKLLNKDSSLKEIWLDFEGESNIQININEFRWLSRSPEDFVKNCPFYFNQKISAYVTNKPNEWLSLEQFYKRDILVGFGSLGGTLLAAEFFLNFGLNDSSVNYEYIKYEYARSLADENSCEMRVQVIF